ncbi:MAG: H-type lectin domain-containing protein [Ignavibacteria bacterium]|jgi:hypothetical protein
MKSIISTVVLVLALGFVTQSTAQHILSGKFDANQSTNGFILHKNEGDRVYTKYVQFEKGFETLPAVVVTVNKIEADKETNLRYEVKAEAVSRDGFTVKIKTWGNTKILNIGGDWVAFAN